MKRNLIANLSKITISILLIPVWFLKIFQGVGHLRSDENSNEIKEVLFYHSPFENIFDMELGVLFYISIILTIVTVVLSIINLKYNKFTKISNYLFIFKIVFFIICVVISSTLARGY